MITFADVFACASPEERGLPLYVEVNDCIARAYDFSARDSASITGSLALIGSGFSLNELCVTEEHARLPARIGIGSINKPVLSQSRVRTTQGGKVVEDYYLLSDKEA